MGVSDVSIKKTKTSRAHGVRMITVPNTLLNFTTVFKGSSVDTEKTESILLNRRPQTCKDTDARWETEITDTGVLSQKLWGMKKVTRSARHSVGGSTRHIVLKSLISNGEEHIMLLCSSCWKETVI